MTDEVQQLEDRLAAVERRLEQRIEYLERELSRLDWLVEHGRAG